MGERGARMDGTGSTAGRIFRAAVAAAATLAALGIGCSSTPGASSVDDACVTYAEAVRARGFRCGVALFPDSDGPDRLPELCATLASADGSALTAAKVASCADALRQEPCGSRITPFCEAPVGTRPEGAPCAVDLQCATGFCRANGIDCGACASPPGKGDTCLRRSQVDQRCAEALGCDLAGARCGAGLRCSVAGTCMTDEPPAPLGAECIAAEIGSCASGLFCDSSNPRSASKCASGGDVPSVDACPAGCPRGEYCSVGKCFAPPDPALGSSCSARASCRSGHGCAQIDGPNGAPSFACRPLVADGGACGLGMPCRAYSSCLAGRCVFLDPARCQ